MLFFFQNAGQSRSFQAGPDARRPVHGVAGRFYASTDTKKIYYDDGTQWIQLASGEPEGVTSVNLLLPNIFSVGGGPITKAGTFTVTLSPQPQRTFFAGPETGTSTVGTGNPSFRVITPADLPSDGYDNSYFKNGGNDFGEADLGTKNANDLTLKTNDTARITVTSDGRVGIGTKNPTVRLEVAGGATKLEQPSWTVASLLGNWQHAGGNYANVSYRVDSMGYLRLRGMARTPAFLWEVGSARPIFTLPPGHRPTHSNMVLVPLACKGGASIIINQSGSVYVDSVIAIESCSTYDISLDSISIPLD